ncbi:MAG: IS6 family transposase [Paracoccaceae bacterium]
MAGREQRRTGPGYRFPCEIILCAVRWYLRYPLSYQDVVDLLAERGISGDGSSVYRWVQKFAPEITKRTEKHLRHSQCRLACLLSADHFMIACRAMDETSIRVGGKWRYLWRAIDANGQMIDFRLTARRDAKAAKAFLNKAIERVRLHRPVIIVTDKAPTYRRVIREINHCDDPHSDSIRHIDRKWRNNLVESDHAAMKRLLGYRQSFRSLRSAKATLSGVETIRTIKRGHIQHRQPGVLGEIAFVDALFNGTA